MRKGFVYHRTLPSTNLSSIFYLKLCHDLLLLILILLHTRSSNNRRCGGGPGPIRGRRSSEFNRWSLRLDLCIWLLTVFILLRFLYRADSKGGFAHSYHDIIMELKKDNKCVFLTLSLLLTMTTSPLLLVVSLCPDGKLRRGGGGGGDLDGFSVRYRGTVNSPLVIQSIKHKQDTR